MISIEVSAHLSALKRAKKRKAEDHQSTNNQDDNVAGDTLLRLSVHECKPPLQALSALQMSGQCELLHSSGGKLEVPAGAELRSLRASLAKI
jgi:hypothetical protein